MYFQKETVKTLSRVGEDTQKGEGGNEREDDQMCYLFWSWYLVKMWIFCAYMYIYQSILVILYDRFTVPWYHHIFLLRQKEKKKGFLCLLSNPPVAVLVLPGEKLIGVLSMEPFPLQTSHCWHRSSSWSPWSSIITPYTGRGWCSLQPCSRVTEWDMPINTLA